MSYIQTMTEGKIHRFHDIHSRGIILSEDGTIARRVKKFGFVFSSRPLELNEKMTVKFMEVPYEKQEARAFCFGITHVNPSEEFEDIQEFTYLDLIKKMNFIGLPLEKKHCQKNTILSFEITTDGILKYNIDDIQMKPFDKKLDVKKKMWAVFYFFENPISIMLLRHNMKEEVSVNLNESKEYVSQVNIQEFEIQECSLCCENDVNVVIYKCGHMSMCYDCAMDQWKGRGDGCCPLCREKITDVIKAYK